MTLAALVLPFALMQAAVGEPALTPEAPPIVEPAQASRFDRCVDGIESDAVTGYEEAMAWAAEAHSVDAYRCAAMALSAQDRHAEAARRFESLAMTISSDHAGMRATLWSQAGNSWLLDRDPARARSAFTRAVTTIEADPQQLPDLLIDRARAYAMEGDYRHAEEDLSRSLDIRPQDSLALRLRASARMNQNSFDLAEADALQALQLAATEEDQVGAALALGHARESKRTGVAVMEQ